MTLSLRDGLRAVYVLNLARRTDRWASFCAAAERAGLSGRLAPRRVEGVDGHGLSLRVPRVTPGEAACTMGHRYLWALALAAGGPVLILEDDAFFCRQFAAHLHEALELPGDADILYLGMSWLRLHPGGGRIRKPASGLGSFASVLFPSGAEKLLLAEAAAPLRPADHYARGCAGLRRYVVYPCWVTVRNTDSDIRGRAPLAQRMGRHFEDDQIPGTAA